MTSEEAEAQTVTSPVLAFHDAKWFAERLDMSESWVRSHAKSLPHHKIGRLLKFDDHCVEIYRDRTAVVPVDSMQRSERSRNRRRK